VVSEKQNERLAQLKKRKASPLFTRNVEGCWFKPR
jgi:hypothetical protein